MAKFKRRFLSFLIAFAMVFSNVQVLPNMSVIAEDYEDDVSMSPTGYIPYEGIEIDDLEVGDVTPVYYGKRSASGRTQTQWNSYGNSYIRSAMTADPDYEEARRVWDALETLGNDLLMNNTDCAYGNGLYYTPTNISSTLSVERMATIWEAFLYSNPQYFFFDSSHYVYRTYGDDNLFAPCVYADFANGSDRMSAKAEFESQLTEYERFLNKAIETCNCTYEIEHIIHNFTCDLLVYDSDAEKSQSVWSAVIPTSDGHPHTVCAGYSKLSTMLLNHYNLSALGVVHDSTTDGHAWNIVHIEDSWYCYDATWDDTSGGDWRIHVCCDCGRFVPEGSTCQYCGGLDAQGKYVSGFGYDNMNRSKSAFENMDNAHISNVYTRWLPLCDTDNRFKYGDITKYDVEADCREGQVSFRCYYCGNDYDTYLLPKSNHDFHSETVAATCTTAGYTCYKCSKCGLEQDRAEIPALGHDWSDWYDLPDRIHQQRDCSRCGAQEQKSSHTHTAGPEVITVEPTCGTTGTGVTYCTICGDKVSERVIPATGEHSWNSGVQVTAPTCKTQGQTKYTCTVCGATKTETDIPTIAHIYVADTNYGENHDGIVAQPTCTTNGSRRVICSSCHGSGHSESIPALGHDWGEWTITRPATINRVGEEKRTCNRCGQEQTRDIPKIDESVYEDYTVDELIARGQSILNNTIDENYDESLYKWLADIEYYIDSKNPSNKTTIKSTLYTAENISPGQGTYITKLIGYLSVAKDEYPDYNTSNMDATTLLSVQNLVADGLVLMDSGEVDSSLYSWLSRVDALNNKSNFCVKQQLASAIDTAENISPGQYFYVQQILGYLQSVLYVYKPVSHTHTSDEGAITTEPTCTAKGVKTYKCTECGTVLRTEDVPALGHNWSNWTVTAAPTVTSTGVETRTCSRCNTTETKTIAKLDCTHQEDEGTVTTQPTCARTGVKTYKCSICGETLRTETIPKTNEHRWNSGVTSKGPTCVLPGEKTFTCTVCHTTKTEQISPLGHSPSTDAAIAATCTQGGKTEGSHCSRCHIVLVRQADTEPLGHNWTNWNVVTEATATADGQEERHCTRCDASETRVIPATGQSVHHHTEDNGTITKAATCSETGVKIYKCTECGEVIRTETIDKIAHTEVEDPAITPTCNSFGRTAGSHCSVCGATIIPTSVIPKTDHNWNDGVVTVEPTKDSTGTKLFTCLHCGATKTEIIPKITDTSTDDPSDNPSDQPGDNPSDTPSDNPGDTPSDNPSDTPSDTPSDQPSDNPGDNPSDNPDVNVIDIGGHKVSISNIPAVKDLTTENANAFTITVDGKELEYGKDYTVDIEPNPEKGIITIVVKGLGDYSGEYRKVINLVANNIKVARIADFEALTYTGEELKPVPVLKANGITLVEGEDYTVTYSNNVDAGVANVIVEGINDYYGKAYKQFIINPKQAVASIELSTDEFKYTGDTQRPDVKIYRDGEEISSDEYTLSVPEESLNPGIYTVRVDLTGNYKGIKIATYQITPKEVTLSDVVSDTKSFTASWVIDDTFSGCQIQYSTEPDFSKNNKVVSVKGKDSYTVKNLSSNQKYYVRIRPCKLVGIKYTTGEWSDAKEVTIK